MKAICPLCGSDAKHFFTANKTDYFDCRNCYSVFMGKEFYPDDNEEKYRYNQHNNDVNDINYQNFVKPIVECINKDYCIHHKGIDFGAGTGPVISKMLRDRKYNIVEYDPFFHNHPELLERNYDYIACCEVIEHFHNPAEEFKVLKKIINKDGKIYCMTSLFNDEIDFKTWYYKNDPTHVFFYRKETFEYIRDYYCFKSVEIHGNLIIISN